MSTRADEVRTDDPPIELLGPETAASRAGDGDEVVQRRPSRLPTMLVAAAVAGLLVAFALLSRPAGTPSDAAAGPDRVAERGSSADGLSIDDAEELAEDPVAQRLALRDIPSFSDTVPRDLPGVISGIDSRGSVVRIDREEDGPTETTFGPGVAATDGAAAWLGVPGSSLVALDGPVELTATELTSRVSGVPRRLDLIDLVPDGVGSVLVVNRQRSGLTATAVAVDGGQRLEWDLDGLAVEVLGLWRDALLVRQGAHTWLLEPSGATRAVTAEQVLAFDGRHLALLICAGVGECRLTVGPPDDPDRRSIPLPATLARLAPSAWTPSLAISPDGSRVAASVDHGALSLPMIVDLETGETRSLADGMNRRAPVVWSPDGQWLAYVYTDDVMVWPLSGERSWRIILDRPLDVLVWR